MSDKTDFTGRTNIGVGRRKLGRMGSIDPGLAEPGQDVTSQLAPVSNRSLAMREVPIPVEEAAIQEFLHPSNGKPVPAAEVERRFQLRQGYLGNALRRRYPTSAALKEALQNSAFSASLVLIEHAMTNMEEMTPAQALLGAKIMTDAGLNIEKSRRDAPRVIDFGELASIGEGIARLNALAGVADALRPDETGLEIRSTGEDEISRY